MSTVCWCFRWEADDPECHEYHEFMQRHGALAPLEAQIERTYEDDQAMCVLPSGHPGPHEFVRQEHIYLTYVPPAAR